MQGLLCFYDDLTALFPVLLRLCCAVLCCLPRSSLVCLENTQNLCGAQAIGPRRMAEMCAAAHGAGLKVHVDGET